MSSGAYGRVSFDFLHGGNTLKLNNINGCTPFNMNEYRPINQLNAAGIKETELGRIHV